MENTINTARLQRSQIKLFVIWSAAIALLMFVSPTDIPIYNRVLVAMSFVILFLPGLIFVKKAKIPTFVNIKFKPLSNFFVVGLILLQTICVFAATAFYTGTDPISAIIDSLSGVNTYSVYQNFFSDQQIADLPLTSRLLYIFALAIAKTVLVVVVANFFLGGNSGKRQSVILLAISTSAYLSFGLARGTFFEAFEITIAFIYFWQISIRKFDKTRNDRKLTTKNIILYSLILLVPVLFIVNSMRRYTSSYEYFDSYCSSNFCFQSWGIDPTLEYIVYIFAIYFSNGPYILSVAIENTLNGNEISYLIPMFSNFYTVGTETGLRGILCQKYVDCKFVWVPEVVNLTTIFGIFTFAVTNYFLIFLARFEAFVFRKLNFAGILLLFFLIIFAFSLPAGNFYTISSSSIVSSFFALVIWAHSMLRSKKPHRVKANAT